MGTLWDVIGVVLRCSASNRTMNGIEHYGENDKIQGRGPSKR